MKPDFHTQAYQAMLASSSNIATFADDGLSPDLHPASADTQAEAVFHVKIPFYLTDANISGDFTRTNPGDVAMIQVSPDGTTWNTVWTDTQIGTMSLTNFNLRTSVYGTWEYYIKVVLSVAPGGAKNDAGVSNLDINTTFDHNKGAMAYLDKGTNHLTFTFDNPQDLAAANARIALTYKWKEFDGTGWTIDRSLVKYVTSSPAAVTIDVGGTKVPRTEYVQMDVQPWLQGDINSDGYVNVGDLQTLIAAWGASEGSGNWNAGADLNDDTNVNVEDLQVLVGRWGQSL